MQAVASHISFASKSAPGADARGNAATSVAQGGEVPMDIFAALLSQQLATTDPSAVDLAGADTPEIPLPSDSEADPAALTAEQMAQFLPLPAMLAMAAPAASMVDAQTKPLASAQPDGLTAVLPGKLAAASANAPAIEEGAAATSMADRQALAEEPASVAASADESPKFEAGATHARATAGVIEKLDMKLSVNDLPQPAPATPTAFAMPPLAPTPARDATPLQAGGAISAPVTSDIWGDKLGERVVWMVGQQHQGVELHLNPPALGPLEIKLSMSDNQATLTFSTQHAPVREAIEAATPRLREMLADTGVSLGSVSVNVGNPSQQNSPGYQPTAESGRQSFIWNAEPAQDILQPSPIITRLPRNGMVDTFA